MTHESITFLRKYVETRSQEAFSRLVERYVDVVYASARRQVGDSDLAQDVTQAVFLVLAQKANSISMDRPLSAWLLTTTRYCASNARRARMHRELHERRAATMARENHASNDDSSHWQELTPLLDEGLGKLAAPERDALVLKYFEKKTLREVGQTLGISEAAATKRVSRAIERLRGFFRKRGVATTSAVLGAMLAAEAASAAPVGLAGAIAATTATTAASAASAATVATTTSASVAKGAIAVMAAEKLKATIIAAVVLLAGVGGGVVAVRTVTSGPKARTTQVAQTPPPRLVFGAASAPTTNAASSVTFSDGTTTTLMGISDAPARETSPLRQSKWASLLGLSGGAGGGAASEALTDDPWWDASGNPTTSPPAFGRNTVSVGQQPDHRALRFVLSTAGPGADEGPVVSLSTASALAINQTRLDAQNLTNIAASVPNDRRTLTIRLGRPYGEFREDITQPVSAQSTAKPRGAKFFGTAKADLAGISVEIDPTQSPRGDRLTRICAITHTGEQVMSSSYESGATSGTVKFTCRLEDVDRLAVLSRPIEWKTMSNLVIARPDDRLIRDFKHREAMANRKVIFDRATKLFEAICRADYSNPDSLAAAGYMVHHDFPSWRRWVCDHFKVNPIVKFGLGPLNEGSGPYKGIPTIDFALTLKDGSVIKGSLPVQYVVNDAQHWLPFEGLDWHLHPPR